LLISNKFLGWETGLATTIALFLHELPHELSDFTIYIKFGLSNAKALGANLFSAMFSYGGLYTGLALSCRMSFLFFGFEFVFSKYGCLRMAFSDGGRTFCLYCPR